MKHLKLILKTLISNNACVEAARTKELKYNIIGIALGILSVLLAILPVSITAFKKTGTDWLNTTYVYAIDSGLWHFCEEANANNIKFTISYDSSNKKTTLKGEGINDNDNYKHYEPLKIGDVQHLKFDDGGRLHCYAYRNTDAGNTYYSFEVYDLTDLDDSKYTKFVSYLVNNLNPYLKEDGKKDEESYLDYSQNDKGEKTKYSRESSFIAFGKKCYYAFLFNPKTRSNVGSTYGDYNHMDNLHNQNIVEKYHVRKSDTVSYNEAIKNTYTNWKGFFNTGYLDTRWANGWKSTGIMIGVDFGVLIFMGIMVFILTRGKNNPFRIYSFWDGQKISYYASFTPGVIALIGFALPQMAMMFYVMCLGVRVMWLSMRTLRNNVPASK